MRGKTIAETNRFFRKKWFVSVIVCFFLCCMHLHAGGTPEETAVNPLYTTWTLSITQFDTSGLTPANQIIGNLVTRNIADHLSSLKARIRSPEEIAYYTEYAWSEARVKSAEALRVKRDERDALLFKGDTNWTYQNKLKTIDEAIDALEEKHTLVEAEYPLVAEQPVFSLSKQNLSGTYPSAPENGMEYSFCKDQNSDAFLTGVVSEYYGRILLSIKLYTLYSRSYIHEDFVLFSVDDQQSALSELSSRLRAAIILLNDMYAGRGSSGEKFMDSGVIVGEAFAEGYETKEFQIDLFNGELAEVFFNLQPIAYEAFQLDTFDGLSSSVYLGSTFMGTTPLTLHLPSNQYEYITMENTRGEAASFIHSGTSSSAVITLSLETDDERTVEDYRKKFYGAYGRFWISLPLAFLAYGVSISSINASNYSGNSVMYDNAVITQNVFIGSAAVAGAFLAESLIRLGIYLYKSNSADVTTIK